ncbi:MAG: hypothetical protein WC142_08550 [Bacteroidales bacterium]|jgi:hypothetical protein|nr:hypothetical protein [Bacteroidales bacterium]MDD2687551.1 hypothetical protein [Bacteroidales bacterium]MDD3331210.1 hypothetical protein [Bacteroidales bacterium]MDD3691965.1 hypothetical protein [Bacteroidales bacterium]MDD4045399.1 hypothetical protein [Bacteroidales bacterium]
MIFDEERAKEIIERYGLSSNKLAIWRSNNHIPNKYNKKDYSVYTGIIYDNIPLMRSQINKIMQTRKLKLTVVNDMSGFGKNKLNRVVQEQGTLKHDEYLRLIEVIDNVKIQTEKALEALKKKNKDYLDIYFANDMINVMALFENDKLIYTKVNQSKKSSKKAFPFEHANDLERFLFTLLLELKFLIVYLHYQAEFSNI